ncbi:hypothetical protein UY286_05920 [Paenibacillus polymyxa]|nr:hypothetical protein [Paenibacillus polymyxa]MDY8116976.1 hypothetical protein [Paenibacillus polymyxa]
MHEHAPSVIASNSTVPKTPFNGDSEAEPATLTHLPKEARVTRLP